MSLNQKKYQKFLALVNDKNTKFVLSLGGGAVRGLGGNYALLEILDELGVQPEEVWGTSAGAVIGGIWCSGVKLLQIKKLLLSQSKRKVLDLALKHILKGLLPGCKIEGLFYGRKIEKVIRRNLNKSKSTFKECRIPFRCIAALDDGSAKRIFNQGKLAPAIRCSMGIPIAFIPRKIGKVEYIDGGTKELTPLPSIIEAHKNSGDRRKLLILCAHFGYSGQPKEVKGIFERIPHIIEVQGHDRFKLHLKEARSTKGVEVHVLNPYIYDTGIFDFQQMEGIIERAKKKFKTDLQQLK